MNEFLKSKVFWIGVVVGVAAYYAYQNYYNKGAVATSEAAQQGG